MTRKSSSPAASEGPQLADFEALLARLQESVARLESRDLTLEEAFQRYEEGCRSFLACRGILEDAKARVEALQGKLAGGEPLWGPFPPAGRSDGPSNTPSNGPPDPSSDAGRPL